MEWYNGNQGAEETSRPRQANDALIHGLGEGIKCCGVFFTAICQSGTSCKTSPPQEKKEKEKRKGGVNQHPYLFSGVYGVYGSRKGTHAMTGPSWGPRLETRSR